MYPDIVANACSTTNFFYYPTCQIWSLYLQQLTGLCSASRYELVQAVLLYAWDCSLQWCLLLWWNPRLCLKDEMIKFYWKVCGPKFMRSLGHLGQILATSSQRAGPKSGEHPRLPGWTQSFMGRPILLPNHSIALNYELKTHTALS